MNTRLVAQSASLLAGLAWLTKSVAIGLAGGLDRSPWEGPLFVLGLAMAVVATVSLVIAATAGRSWWLRSVLAVAAVIASVLLTLTVDRTVHLVTDSEHWVTAEVNLWFLATVLLALAWWPQRRDTVPAVRVA